ncbi:MAG: hypothetical protein ACYCXK_02005 [Candidatus Humimicrobiaceae bacterium]
MTNEIKSGQEIIDEFFSEILEIKALDQKIVEVLINLHREDKLTNTNLSNELERIRGEN